jgi:hypothetical protein
MSVMTAEEISKRQSETGEYITLKCDFCLEPIKSAVTYTLKDDSKHHFCSGRHRDLWLSKSEPVKPTKEKEKDMAKKNDDEDELEDVDTSEDEDAGEPEGGDDEDSSEDEEEEKPKKKKKKVVKASKKTSKKSKKDEDDEDDDTDESEDDEDEKPKKKGKKKRTSSNGELPRYILYQYASEFLKWDNSKIAKKFKVTPSTVWAALNRSDRGKITPWAKHSDAEKKQARAYFKKD